MDVSAMSPMVIGLSIFSKLIFNDFSENQIGLRKSEVLVYVHVLSLEFKLKYLYNNL